MESVNILSVRR